MIFWEVLYDPNIIRVHCMMKLKHTISLIPVFMMLKQCLGKMMSHSLEFYGGFDIFLKINIQGSETFFRCYI